MGMKNYLKRLGKALLNKPMYTYSTEKEYVISNSKQVRFAGKIAVVTGASGEIGGAIAKRLAIEGATVYLGGRNISRLNDMADLLRHNGAIGIPLKIDVTSEQSVAEACDRVMSDAGKIDILVNCAGGSTRSNCANLMEQKIELIDEMLNINLRGSMLCTREIGGKMIEKQFGRIINISSVIGEHGKPKYSDYAAAKAGIIGYTKSVAQELGQYGITVNCISPGFIQRGTFTDEQLLYLLKSNFVNRVGNAVDIASAVAYLASNEASFITGQNLCVDGGRSLGLHGD